MRQKRPFQTQTLLVRNTTWNFLLVFGLGLGLYGLSALAGDSGDSIDGQRCSGKKVQVSQWGEDLEIHAYPSGSLKGRVLRLDSTNQNQPDALDSSFRLDTPDLDSPQAQRSIANVKKHPSSLRKTGDLPDPQEEENSESESGGNHSRWLDW